MKIEIMIKILFVLLSRDKVSSSYLATRFEISRRTVMRYIDALCIAGIPIIANQGRYGGYYIAQSFKLPSSFMTESEFEIALSTLSSCNEQLQSEDLSSAISKLIAVNRKTEGASVQIKSGNLIIDGSSWNGSDSMKTIVSMMEKAIESQNVVKISYRDKNGGETIRDIEPHVIVLKQGLWYVYAYCRLRNEFRMFKVARIIYANILKATFKKKQFDPSTMRLSGLFEAMPSENVDLIADKSVKSELEEWLGVECVNERSDGQVLVSAKFPIESYLVSEILRFGGKVKVVAPEKLKKMVLDSAKSLIKNYS